MWVICFFEKYTKTFSFNLPPVQLLGELVDDYEITGVLGRGASSVVYQATSRIIKPGELHDIAVKAFLDSCNTDDIVAEFQVVKFLNERQAQWLLFTFDFGIRGVEGVAKCHNLFISDTLAYFTMEMVQHDEFNVSCLLQKFNI